MQRISSFGRAIRAFWADSYQRKTLMWVLGAVGVLIAAFGAYTAIDGHLQYTDLSDKIADIVARRDAFTQQFPLAEVNGEMRPDLSTATQADLMVITVSRQDEIKADAQRVDADNQRRNGVRLLGIGIIGVALAYIVSPDSKPESSPDEAGTPPDVTDETAA
jgi:hypothetical protein